MGKCTAAIFYEWKYGRNSRREAQLFTMFRRGTNEKDKKLRMRALKICIIRHILMNEVK
jgi:hypothetical protein